MGPTMYNFKGTRVFFCETVGHLTVNALAPKGWKFGRLSSADNALPRRIFFFGSDELSTLEFTKLNSDLIEAGFAVVLIPPQASSAVCPREAKDSTVVVTPTTVGLFALTRSLGYEWEGFDTDLEIAMAGCDNDPRQYSPTGAKLAQVLRLLPPPDDEASSVTNELALGVLLFCETTTKDELERISAVRNFEAWVSWRQKTKKMEEARETSPVILTG